MSDISLIVSTYNWPQALKLCLLSIKRQTILPLEVIIADDGSDYNTTHLIASLKNDFPVPLIHVWHEDSGFRKTIILNKAIKKASGCYILQIDGDVILDKHFVSDHLKIREPKVFIRGTRAHISEKIHDRLYTSGRLNYSFISKGVINRFNAVRIPLLSFLFQKKSSTSDRVRGSNLAYWKADFIAVNGYNNDLTGWGHEDEELAARFVNNKIAKKTVKLRAVQYHISHNQLSWEDEANHFQTVKNTLKTKLKVCTNGYEQS